MRGNKITFSHKLENTNQFKFSVKLKGLSLREKDSHFHSMCAHLLLYSIPVLTISVR